MKLLTSSKFSVCIFDCLTGKSATVERFPFKFGSSPACDWRIDDPAIPAEWFEIQKMGSKFFVKVGRNLEVMTWDDSAACTAGEIDPGTDHTACLGNQFLVIRLGKPAEWLGKTNHSEWFVYDEAASACRGPYPRDQLPTEIERFGQGGNTLLLCSGMTSRGFYARQILPAMFPQGVPKARLTPQPSETPSMLNAEEATINVIYGEFTCPVCWLKFDRGDVMNIAVHASLRGDPVLGDFEMLRFHATRFNDKGIAIDAMGVPAPQQCCPHCRRRLPSGFLDRPHHIFSIVGAPSSGKSYYLSVLIKMLQNILFREFGVVFRDSDPAGNAVLNQMITRLFSQASPQDAFIAKTDLEGDLYESLPRYGQNVKLPKPFIFKLSEPSDPASDFSIVLYDNAGEHFQPGRNSDDSPGAQHISVASGIFFLFDPLHSADFLRAMGDVSDPQAAERRDEQQEILLAESEVRIKTLLGMESSQRIATPLAIMIGKSDTWQHLLGPDPLRSIVVDRKIDPAAIQENSDRIRKLLCSVSPAIVANAEALSSNVRYFAISPLGSSPVVFTDDLGNRKVGPDPSTLNPRCIEDPTLWVLSEVAPSLVPSKR